MSLELGQLSDTRTKYFLSRTLPALHQVQPATVRQMRVPQPAQVISVHQHLNI